jgi:O-6-methylguanine DNA methyltransferase
VRIDMASLRRPDSRPLRLSDASALAAMVRREGPRSLSVGAEDLLNPETAAIDWIRARAEEERASGSWVLAVESEKDRTLAGVAGLRRIDSVRSSAELLFLVFLDEPERLDLLDRILKTAFYHFGLHRIEMRFPELGTPMPMLPGWTLEGVLRGALPQEGGFRDAKLLSILQEEFDGYGIAFVPFSRGFVHIRGDRSSVDAVGFLRPDQLVEPGPLLSAAFLQGICDRAGAVLPQGARVLDPQKGQRLPAEVEKAARQVEEYIAGERTSFDFRTRVSGSLFQQKVWAMLSEIPYGTTLTYEQVALRMTENDPGAARRLTRAVGSACSANPLAIVVPCHRVIGKDNKLVGFSGGLDVKEWLLEHEMFGVG